MNLEEHIKRNKEAWDAAEPPIGHEKRFEDRLKIQEPKNNWANALWGAIAAVAIIILVMNGASFIGNRDGNDAAVAVEEDTATATQTAVLDLQNAETFYQRTIKLKQSTSPSAQGFEQDELLQTHLAKLDSSYQALAVALARFPEDERIIKRMIENYSLRIKLLERHAQKINKSKIINSYEKS